MLYESSSSISYREIKIILNVIVQKEVMLKNVHFREKILWHKQGFPVHNRFANWLFIQLTKGFHFKSSTMMTFFSRCCKFGNGIFPSGFQCFLKYISKWNILGLKLFFKRIRKIQVKAISCSLKKEQFLANFEHCAFDLISIESWFLEYRLFVCSAEN